MSSASGLLARGSQLMIWVYEDLNLANLGFLFFGIFSGIFFLFFRIFFRITRFFVEFVQRFHELRTPWLLVRLEGIEIYQLERSTYWYRERWLSTSDELWSSTGPSRWFEVCCDLPWCNLVWWSARRCSWQVSKTETRTGWGGVRSQMWAAVSLQSDDDQTTPPTL